MLVQKQRHIFPQSLKSTCRQFRICLRCLFANETYAKECPELYCKWSTLKTEKIPSHVTFLSMDYLYRSLNVWPGFPPFFIAQSNKTYPGKMPYLVTLIWKKKQQQKTGAWLHMSTLTHIYSCNCTYHIQLNFLRVFTLIYMKFYIPTYF